MKITKVNCPKSKYDVKCPYEMTPEFIVVHNTYNDASAMAEVSYMLGNDNKTSFHVAVDDKEIVQGIDFNRNAFHAGDGRNGKGNRKGIAVEICYSKSGGERFNKAENLAAEYIAYLLKERKWGIDKVKKHQDFSGKYCPHRTLDLGWERFLNLIQSHLETYVIKYVKVKKELNVRKEASENAKVVSSLSNNAMVKVYEEKNGWSRIGNNKWVSSKYLVKNNDTNSYYPRCNSKYTSLVDALNSIKVDSSLNNRKKIASKNGINDYKGTENQNVKMLELLKNVKLKK